MEKKIGQGPPPPPPREQLLFFLETVPKESKCFYKSHLAAHEVKATTQCYSCGYMKKGDSIAEEIPEVPFCNGKKSSPTTCEPEQ